LQDEALTTVGPNSLHRCQNVKFAVAQCPV